MLAPSSICSINFPILKKEVIFSTEELLKKFQHCAREQFTGQLDLQIIGTQLGQCHLYFSLGSLMGCSSPIHPVRRWYRQLSLHCPQLMMHQAHDNSKSPQCWDYDSLAVYVRKGQVLLGEMSAIVGGYSTELLFDMIQLGEQISYRSGLQLSYRAIPQESVDLGWVTIHTDQVWQEAINTWQAWQQAGIPDISPNLAPTILNAEELRQQTSPPAYRNLTTLANGTETLRDLAVKLKQNVLPLTQSILPYIRSGLMGLIEVGDLSQSIKPLERDRLPQIVQETAKKTQIDKASPSIRDSSSTPLIAYIDDSRLDSQTMSDILSKAGYQFINIQDSVQALVQLLEHKPQLIFLDLVMPIANGYEICSQIRRVSIFSDTPVIIVTSNDGIVDRVRARMVGASGFLAKPITQQKVLGVLQRYLPTKTTKPQLTTNNS